MTALCFLFAEGSYDILNLPQNARSLALNNTTSANDGSFLQNNPAVLSLRSRGTTYSYFYLPANIHFGGVQHSFNVYEFGSKYEGISMIETQSRTFRTHKIVTFCAISAFGV